MERNIKRSSVTISPVIVTNHSQHKLLTSFSNGWQGWDAIVFFLVRKLGSLSDLEFPLVFLKPLWHWFSEADRTMLCSFVCTLLQPALAGIEYSLVFVK